MIGVIGLGGMGSGIVATLLRNDFDTVVFDIDPARMEQASGEGAVAARDVPDLCTRCESIILSLPSSRVAVEVLERQILPHVRKGSTVIDMGTTLVRETRRLHALFAQRGADLIDAPVSGGTGGAARGELFIFVGGDKPAADRSWDLLKVLGGTRVTYCGGSGCGQITKGVNQLAMGIVDAAYIEAVAFGVNAGVPAEVLREAIGGDSGFREKFRAIASQVAEGRGDGNDIKYAEYAYFLDHCHNEGFPSPILEALHSYLNRFPETHRDNMNRPYPPLYSALTGGKK